MNGKSADRQRYWKLLSVGVAAVVAAGAIGAAAAGFGSKTGIWNFRTGFSILRWCGYAEITAFLAAVSGGIGAARLRLWRPLALFLLSMVASLALGVSLVSWKMKAISVPAIHDITTDITNPPRFAAILPLRAGAPNASEYRGAEIAVMQRRGYPDLRTAVLSLPAERAFAAALDTAKRLGWRYRRGSTVSSSTIFGKLSWKGASTSSRRTPHAAESPAFYALRPSAMPFISRSLPTARRRSISIPAARRRRSGTWSISTTMSGSRECSSKVSGSRPEGPCRRTFPVPASALSCGRRMRRCSVKGDRAQPGSYL